MTSIAVLPKVRSLPGVLIGAVGPRGATLKIRPPLPISGEDADTLVHGLARALAALPRP